MRENHILICISLIPSKGETLFNSWLLVINRALNSEVSIHHCGSYVFFFHVTDAFTFLMFDMSSFKNEGGIVPELVKFAS